MLTKISKSLLDGPCRPLVVCRSLMLDTFGRTLADSPVAHYAPTHGILSTILSLGQFVYAVLQVLCILNSVTRDICEATSLCIGWEKVGRSKA
jgi:hypothetical protein